MKDASPADINRDLSILRRMFNLAVEDERLLHVPKVPLLAEHGIRTGFFELDQLNAVLRQLSEPLRPVVEFAYVTGWRLSEITGLQWRNIDRNGGEIRWTRSPRRAGSRGRFQSAVAWRRILDARAG